MESILFCHASLLLLEEEMIDNNYIDELIKRAGIEERTSPKRITKAEIMAVEDDNERMKLIAENRDLF